MDKVTEVNNFIEENILHSHVWDTAEETTRKKAVNQAERTLKRYFKDVYSDVVPVDHLAEQSIWILKIDDMLQRSEMGVTYISVEGVQMNITNKDKSICPFIMEELNLSEGWNSRRKVGRYVTSLLDSRRKGW